jgi:hypothetical protein
MLPDHRCQSFHPTRTSTANNNAGGRAMSAFLPRRSRSVDSALPAKDPTTEPEDSSPKRNASHVIPYQLDLFGTGAYLGLKDLSPRLTPTAIHDYAYVNRQTSIDRHRIRLIRLYPAVSRNTPLVCDLRVVSLDENPEYTALSYCWGDPIFDHEIICEGKTFLVTARLSAALRQIRLLQPDQRPLWQPLWVDQICIYSHRTAMNHFGIMRFASQFFEGFNFTYLTSQYIRLRFQFVASLTLTSLFAWPCQFFDLI